MRHENERLWAPAWPGRLRALATGGAKRANAFPDLPTLQQLGYPIEGTGWFGLVGPRVTHCPR